MAHAIRLPPTDTAVFTSKMVADRRYIRRSWLRWSIYLVVVAVIGVVANETLHWWNHVTETEAKVEVDFTLLSSSVNGTVATVHVGQGQVVKRGTLLATMDTDVAELDVASLEAQLATERANRAMVEAELRQFKIELNDKLASARAAVRRQQREHATLVDRRKIAERHVARYTELAGRKTISGRQLDTATDQLLVVTNQLRQMETAIETAEQKVVELTGTATKEQVYQSEIEAIDRAIERDKVLLRQSRQRLDEMHIRAPVDGIIDEVYVSAGVYVEDGDKAFLMHNPNSVWLEARIDESDISLVAPGQKVEIEFDAYYFDTFEGTVRAIRQATLGAMKNGGTQEADPRMAQRIPVIIDLPRMEKPVWPGMRATVNIVVR